MPRTLADMFEEHKGVEIIEVMGYDDGKPFGLADDGRKLKIIEPAFVDELLALPGATTADGHTTVEGYFIRGGADINQFASKAFVHRSKKTVR